MACLLCTLPLLCYASTENISPSKERTQQYLSRKVEVYAATTLLGRPEDGKKKGQEGREGCNYVCLLVCQHMYI